MRRWLNPALDGLSTDEVAHLNGLGYGRWLEKKKLTAPMIVALIDRSLLFLEAFAEERPRHPADERARMIDAGGEESLSREGLGSGGARSRMAEGRAHRDRRGVCR